MSIDPRDRRIDRLEAVVEALLKRVETLEIENRELRAENAELKAKLSQNSNNSSKPPDAPCVERETALAHDTGEGGPFVNDRHAQTQELLHECSTKPKAPAGPDFGVMSKSGAEQSP